MRRLYAPVFSAIVLIAGFTRSAAADSVAFTDLGPGGSYTTDNGYQVSGTHGGDNVYTGYVAIADLFTASLSGTLSRIDLGLSNINGTNSAIVSLYTDTGGNLGTLLFSGNVSNQPHFPGSTGLISLAGNSALLTAGTNYFMVVAPGGDTTFDIWNSNGLTPKLTGTVLSNIGSGFGSPVTDVLSAFDVKVDATRVPESSFWITLAAELIVLLGAAKLKLLNN